MKRRDFLKRAGTGAGAAAAAGAAVDTAAAQAQPDFGAWLDGVDGGFTDARGQSEVTVQVGAEGNGGNFAFSPAGLWVDPGTEVTWEWTGQGSTHNVHAVDGATFSSETTAEEGFTYSHTFEQDGAIIQYQCDPHSSLGMKGAVAVGDGVPTTGGGGGGGGGGQVEMDPHNMGVPFQAHFVGIATVLMMIVSVIYTFFVLKYGESSHASAPNKQ